MKENLERTLKSERNLAEKLYEAEKDIFTERNLGERAYDALMLLTYGVCTYYATKVTLKLIEHLTKISF